MIPFLRRSSDKGRFPDNIWRASISPILSGYILREFRNIFLLTLSSVLCLSFIIRLFEEVDLFIEYHAEAVTIIEYFIFYIPMVLFHGTPMAVLLATMLTLGILSRNSELVAVKAAGLSLYSIAIPILSVAFFISIVSFVFNESVVFSTNQRLSYVKEVKIKKRPARAIFKQDKVWMRGRDNTIINIHLLNPDEERLYGVTLYRFDDRFNLVERVDAKEVRWTGNQWLFLDGKIRLFLPDGRMNERDFDATYYSLSEDPKDFRRVEKKSEEMNILELYRYIQRLKMAGYRTTRHVVDMHSKVSYAFMSFIMALFSVPFCFKGGRGEGIVKGIGISILIAVIYWIIFASGISLGRAGIFPPFFAAWIGNLIFGAVGLYMLLGIKQ